MPIAHGGVNVKDLERASAFYLEALKPLGYRLSVKMDGIAIGLAAPWVADFWVVSKFYTDQKAASGRDEAIIHSHIAFCAGSRGEVRRFYEAAMKAGGTDNGPPGLRPNYRDGYYAAFVLDPDGHNIEALCYSPWWMYAIGYGKYVAGFGVLVGTYWLGQNGMLGRLSW